MLQWPWFHECSNSLLYAFVLPSNFEGLGIAAVEAQCAGLPCVMSDKVPKDADIIDSLCRFIPLSKKDEFVKEIIQFSDNKRIDCSEKIIESGYSLKGEKYVDEK